LDKRAIRNTALAVLLPLLLLNTGSVRTLYRCVFDQVARTHCCCPTAARPQRLADGPIAKPSCCNAERSQAGTPAQARLDRGDAMQLRAPVATLTLADLYAFLRPAVARPGPVNGALGPPPGPPLILLKRSLLI
jgi:hypothetical protein